ncbi:MAG: ATP-dependent helicase RecG [Glaciihabitans sp.]|nr:ATP-dependent helicase RecG [Glaciihabitans sp.]
MTSPLDEKLKNSVLSGRTASVLEKSLNLLTVGDLLTHYPRRYARRGELTALAELELDSSVTIVAEVLQVQERPMKNRKGSIVEVKISDGSGILILTFFNQGWRAQQLRPGMRGIFAGKVGEYRGIRQLAHPDYELFADAPEVVASAAMSYALEPIPIYPATSTVTSWQLQSAIRTVLDTLPTLDDPVPLAVRAERGLLNFSKAIELVHRPEKDADWQSARRSLRFQEAFVLQAALLQQRMLLRSTAATPRLPGTLATGFDAAMPFTLTGDQTTVGEEIAVDMAKTTPMNRLLQGEVGSGKTLVALRAMLAVADTGGQSALLAPTEVLAAQHLRSIVATLGPDLAARLRPTLLTGQMSVPERRKAMLAAVSGSASIVIGTHALLSESVAFFDLGLVVVDEQHRFGVEQREALRQKGEVPPHVLVLTATPIPRTVAMTVFGDLDISTIAELPSGRIPIKSFVVPRANKRLYGRVWERVAEEVATGRQAFVVCPAIDAAVPEPADAPAGTVDGAASGTSASRGGSLTLTAQLSAKAAAKEAAKQAAAEAALFAAEQAKGDAETPSTHPATVAEVTEGLRHHPLLANARIASLHGRMPSEQKDAVMRSFAAGQIDVLVATTVIEVGVDVPNASAMVILDADRFGVSQLHQLRGRVGRGSVPGICLMVTGADEESLALERVQAVASTLDGFELAQKDLELRREGDVLSTIQSGGRSSLRLLRVATDGELIGEAREAAGEILDTDPMLADHTPLREALLRRLDESEATFLAKN